MTRTIRSIAALAAVAVAALAASLGAPPSAHALASKATIEITKKPDVPGMYIVLVEGVIGTPSVGEAQDFWKDGESGKMGITVIGDDTIYDDSLFVFYTTIAWPTIAGLPFKTGHGSITGALLNEDDYAGNRRDEIYAEIYKLDDDGDRNWDVPSVRTNTVVGYF